MAASTAATSSPPTANAIITTSKVTASAAYTTDPPPSPLHPPRATTTATPQGSVWVDLSQKRVLFLRVNKPERVFVYAVGTTLESIWFRGFKH
nr:hypothetical protein [Tanacetum cinerariifolium]